MPHQYKTQNLDHLGLVAGMFDELGIGELLDQLITQDHGKRHVSIGQAVKAMIINGLGFVNQNLYLVPSFFSDKPVGKLIAPELTSEHLNDDVLGRALDKLYENNVTSLFYQVSCRAVQRLGLKPAFGNLDSTSFHADGRYESSGTEDGVIHITKGYSRDHRPDLNQVVLNLITENQAGIPILMSPGSGNSNDKTAFREIIEQHIKQLEQGHQIDYIVADSALYTSETLQSLSPYGTHWITRVPEVIVEAKEAISSTMYQEFEPYQPGYRYLPHVTTYAGIEQRWMVIFSEAAKERSYKTLKKRYENLTSTELQQFEKLKRERFACQEDAERALSKALKKHKVTELAQYRVIEHPVYDKPGRPKAGEQPSAIEYSIDGVLFSRTEEFYKSWHQKSCFIVATNQLDENELSDQDILIEYKGQNRVEKGFRFLKDPMFLSDALFLKSAKRIMALMMIMTLCLLIYAAVEYKIRLGLKNTDTYFPHQTGKPIQNPTARWVFMFFHGIHILLLPDGNHIVTNLNEHHQMIIGLMGANYQYYYS